MGRANSLEKILMLGKIEGKKQKGVTEDELFRWHHWLKGHELVSRREWRTGKPGVLLSMQPQRVRHDRATEQQRGEGAPCSCRVSTAAARVFSRFLLQLSVLFSSVCACCCSWALQRAVCRPAGSFLPEPLAPCARFWELPLPWSLWTRSSAGFHPAPLRSMTGASLKTAPGATSQPRYLSHLSEITDLYCLVSSVLKAHVSCFFALCSYILWYLVWF